jgi:hypothetical protein
MTCENPKSRRPDHFIRLAYAPPRGPNRQGFLGHARKPKTYFGVGMSTDVPIPKEGVLFIKVGDILYPALWQKGDGAMNADLVFFWGGRCSRLYSATAIAGRVAKCRFGTGSAISTIWPALVPEMQNPPARDGSVPLKRLKVNLAC